jgi:hypothetical protein
MWYIDKNVLGTQGHLVVYDGHLGWSENAPAGFLCEDTTLSAGGLASYLKIIGKSTSIIPYDIQQSLTLTQIPSSHAGLRHLLRPQEFQSLLSEYTAHVNASLIEFKEYLPTYIRNCNVLSKCMPAKFDLECLNHYDKLSLNDDGFAPPPVYDIAGTKTGRMRVIEGTQVLTMPREIKGFIRSRYKGGVVVEIDYSALEPRTALCVAESDFADSGDIYLKIAEIFGGISREAAKQITISFLYGAAPSTVRRLAGHVENFDKKLKNLRSVFGFERVVKKAIDEINKKGFFYNHAGRPLNPQSNKEGLLFNNFCQSSAVDVALSGFSNMLEQFQDKCPSAVPLFFIHDALILDLKPEDLSAVKEISCGINTYLNVEFPTKLKILNT